MSPKGSGPVVLEEAIDEDYEPSEQEISEYAVWLGMDPETDKELFWIAREGLKAPLPAPWKPCLSEDEETFYFNFETGDSVWEHPCDEHYRKLYKEEKVRAELSQHAKCSALGAVSGARKLVQDRRRVSFDLSPSPVSMDLPSPGDSLYGKHSQRHLVLAPKDCGQKTPSSPLAPKSKIHLGPLQPQPQQAQAASSSSAKPKEEEPEVLECAVGECSADWGRLGELRRDFEARWRRRMQEVERGLLQELERERTALERQLSADLEAETRRRIEREVEEKLRPWAEELEQRRRSELEHEAEERLRAAGPGLEEGVRARLECEAEREVRELMPELLRRAREKLEGEAEEMLRPSMADYRQQAEARLRRELEEELRPQLEVKFPDRLGDPLEKFESEARASLERRMVEDRLQLLFTSAEQAAARGSGGDPVAESVEAHGGADRADGGDEVDGLLERLGEDLEGSFAPGLIDEVLERLGAGPAEQGSQTAAVEAEAEARAGGVEAAAAADAEPPESEIPEEIEEDCAHDLESEIPEEVEEEEEEEEEREEAHKGALASERRLALSEPLKCRLEDDVRSNASAYTLIFEPLSPSSTGSAAGLEPLDDLPSPSAASEADGHPAEERQCGCRRESSEIATAEAAVHSESPRATAPVARAAAPSRRAFLAPLACLVLFVACLVQLVVHLRAASLPGQGKGPWGSRSSACAAAAALGVSFACGLGGGLLLGGLR